MVVHAELWVHKTVTVGANLHCLIYNLLIAIIFSLHILLKDMLNTKGLVILTEYQQVGWRLVKVENYDNYDQRHK